jgi:NADPH:quinone reductase-like Zn-dependent oxidoreductase
VQIAKWLGAEVTGVCSSGNTELVSSLGADHVIDYTEVDFTQTGQRYDLIFDNVGGRPFSDYRRALAPDGRLLPNTGNAGIGYALEGVILSAFLRRKAHPFHGAPTSDDLRVLKGLLESGLLKPVVDKTYSLDQTPKAIAQMGSGHARGKVVITLTGSRSKPARGDS